MLGFALDLSSVVSVVRYFMPNPRMDHCDVVKWILHYVKSSLDKHLVFDRSDSTTFDSVGYANFDYASDLGDRRFNSIYIFTLSVGVISWKISLPSSATLPTHDTEYVTTAEGSEEVTWLQGLIIELGVAQSTTVLFSDSHIAIHLTKNDTYHSNTKHISVKYHFIQDIIVVTEIVAKEIHKLDNPQKYLLNHFLC